MLALLPCRSGRSTTLQQRRLQLARTGMQRPMASAAARSWRLLSQRCALHAVLLVEVLLQLACAGPSARLWSRCSWTWLLA